MTEKKTKPTADQMKYIVVTPGGKILGTFPTKAGVCKLLNTMSPVRAYVSERDEACKYHLVATYDLGSHIKNPFAF